MLHVLSYKLLRATLLLPQCNINLHRKLLVFRQADFSQCSYLVFVLNLVDLVSHFLLPLRMLLNVILAGVLLNLLFRWILRSLRVLSMSDM